ncbi:hypothetical protein [Clostridium cavendishii]|nr:hypothetical protein [Clostridium cavendishii]
MGKFAKLAVPTIITKVINEQKYILIQERFSYGCHSIEKIFGNKLNI